MLSPGFTSIPGSFVAPEALVERGWEPARAPWLLEAPDPITEAQFESARQTAAASGKRYQRAGWFSRHSWAIGLLEARGSEGPAALRYSNAILGNLRTAGFSVENAAHAFWLLDSYVYGHVIQEASMPTSPSDVTTNPTDPEQDPIDEYPHLVEIGQHARRSEFSFDGEFEFGLDLVLDALDQIATCAAAKTGDQAGPPARQPDM